MGIKEQLIFPEINYDKVDTIKGMNIVFTTTARTDEEAAALLAGRRTKKRRLRRPLRLLGAALLAAGLIYGVLTMLLLGGID